MNAPESQPDPMAEGLRAAFGSDRTPESSLLRQLDLRGVHLPDADAHDDAHDDVPVTIDDATKALRDPSGRYQVLGEIGRGGVGIVYKGRDVDLGRDVAMKVLRPEHASHPEILARFVEEAQIGGQLQHPGIVPVYELGLQHGERPYFAMKLIKGETLAALLGKRKHAGEDRRRFLGFFEQICQTVAYAHARRVVHRDLKPANVMIGAFGEVQVVDWGFAKILPKGGVADEAEAKEHHSAASVITSVRSGPGSGSKSVQGSMLGTPAYMPPEQAQGDVAHVDRRSDVFALGAILCEILTGLPPYESGDRIRQAALAELEPCHERLARSGADAPLIALCKECLSPARQARPASAQEVAARVIEYLSSIEDRARQAQIHAAEAKVKARATVMLSAAAVLLLALGGGGWLFVEQQAQTRREQATLRVATAMNETNVRFGKASAAGISDRSLWELAVDAGVHTEQLAADQDVDAEQRAGVAALLVTLRAEQQKALAEAQRLAKDEAMRQRLLEVRIPSDESHSTAGNWREHEERRMDQGYAAAFRKYLGDRDLASLTVEEALVALHGRIAVELAVALSHWALVRTSELFASPDDKCVTTRLQAVAAALDCDDPQRTRLRSLLAESNVPHEEIAQLATAASQQNLPAVGYQLFGEVLDRLGIALGNADLRSKALAIYRQGCDRYPDDSGLCIGLAAKLEATSRPAAAAAQWRTARALRPTMRGVRHRLGVMLEQLGEHGGAEQIFLDLVREDAGNGHWLSHLGACLACRGQFEAAIDNHRRAIQIDPLDAFAHTALGMTLAEQGKLDDGVAVLRAAMEIDPKLPMTHILLGSVLQRQRKLEEAVARFRHAIDLDPSNALAYSSVGGVLQQQGKLPDAIDACRHALALDPNLAIAHNNLGVALVRSGKTDEAIASYARAIECNPGLAIAHGNLGERLTAQGRTDEGIASCRRALDLDPGLAMAHANLGIALRAKGSLEAAKASCQRAIALDPTEAFAHANLGGVLADQGMLDAAMVCCSRAIDLRPDLATAHHNLGDVLRARGKVDEAIVSYRRAIELDPRNAATRNQLALALVSRGELEDAVASYRQAIGLTPKAAYIYSNLGFALAELGKFDEAIASHRRAIELNPMDALSYSNLGNTQVRQGDYEGGIASCRHAVELDPRLALAHFNLGWGLASQGKLDTALLSLQSAIEFDPKAANMHAKLGSVLAELGRFDDALKSYWRAVDLGLNRHMAIALVLDQQGRSDEALVAMRQAVALSPQDVVACTNLGAMLVKQGMHEEGITFLRRAITMDPAFGQAHFNLGGALLAQEDLEGALESFGRAQERWRQTRDQTAAAWQERAAQVIAETESRLASRRELLKITRGERQATTVEQWTGAGEAAYQVGDHIASARTYARSFAAFPELLPTYPHRYNAACAAALAGCGKGEGVAKLKDDDRAALRMQAREWLRAEFERWVHDIAAGDDMAKAAKEQVAHAQQDPDFDGVRSDAALQNLPADEAESWRALWRDIASTLDGKEQPR